MFIEKELDKDSSPFQKDHVYILRGVVDARRNTLAGTAGTLDGREGGMVMCLTDIEEDGTHVFHEMVYARDECQIVLDGYCCEYTVEPKELNINDFEDITDDADFTELLRSIKKNEKEAEPWMKRMEIRGMLIEKAITIITLLLLILIFAIGMYGLVFIKNNLHNHGAPDLLLMICGGIVVSLIFGIAVGAQQIRIKIEKWSTKKDCAVLETIYKKNDALLQTFEQKKHLEKTQ